MSLEQNKKRAATANAAKSAAKPKKAKTTAKKAQTEASPGQSNLLRFLTKVPHTPAPTTNNRRTPDDGADDRSMGSGARSEELHAPTPLPANQPAEIDEAEEPRQIRARFGGPAVPDIPHEFVVDTDVGNH